VIVFPARTARCDIAKKGGGGEKGPGSRSIPLLSGEVPEEKKRGKEDIRY